jgi:hypothetical protein
MTWLKIEDGYPPLTVPFLCIVTDETYGDSLIYYAYVDPNDEKYYEGCTYQDVSPYSRRIGIGELFRHRITHWMHIPELPK